MHAECADIGPASVPSCRRTQSTLPGSDQIAPKEAVLEPSAATAVHCSRPERGAAALDPHARCAPLSGAPACRRTKSSFPRKRGAAAMLLTHAECADICAIGPAGAPACRRNIVLSRSAIAVYCFTRCRVRRYAPLPAPSSRRTQSCLCHQAAPIVERSREVCSDCCRAQPGFLGFRISRESSRRPQSMHRIWTVLQHDGPDHRGLCFRSSRRSSRRPSPPRA